MASHSFAGATQSLLDTLRVLTATVGVMLLGYLLHLVFFRRRNVYRFAPRAMMRVVASLIATLIVILACLTRLGDSLSFFLPLGILYIFFSMLGYRVTAPVEHAASEDALREAHEVADD